jgi:hypothetical protein
MLNLPNVTLLALGSTQVEENLLALQYSMKEINFGAVKFISHELPESMPEGIQYEKFKDFGKISYKEFSYYCIHGLINHVDTEFMLMIHPDGFIINPESWDDDFLLWDYIGAPWPIKADAFIDPFGNHHRVGNGGFTLRSRKILEIPHIEEIPFEVNEGTFYKHMNAGAYNEDGNICVHNRHLFEKHGAKFAPVDVAARFSHEIPTTETSKEKKPFGFHRYLPGTYPKRFNFKLPETRIHSNFLVVNQYKYDVSWVKDYTNNYMIYDKGNTEVISDKVRSLPNVGHNIHTYLHHIVENYEKLPEVTIFVKGDVFPRHCKKEKFLQVMNNKTFTSLESYEHVDTSPSSAMRLTSDGGYLEINNSWYVPHHVSRHFRNYNEFLSTIFKEPVHPEWVRFAPGANYIVPRENIIKYEKRFYEKLISFIDYVPTREECINKSDIPAECHIIERALYTIWNGTFEVREDLYR